MSRDITPTTGSTTSVILSLSVGLNCFGGFGPRQQGLPSLKEVSVAFQGDTNQLAPSPDFGFTEELLESVLDSTF